MFLLLLKKDFLCLWRKRRFFFASAAFSVLLVVVCSFSLQGAGFEERVLQKLSPALISLVFLFSGVLGLNYSFAAEEENGAMIGVLLTPASPELVFLSKFLGNAAFLGLVQLIIFAVYGILLNLDLWSLAPGLLVVAALLIAGFSALGTLFSAIAVATRGRELLLPILLFPLLLPLLGASVFVMRDLFALGVLDWGQFSLKLIAGFDLIAFLSAIVLFEYAVRS